jgi:hypothetical protein
MMIHDGIEINAVVIDRIATLVAYECSDDEIVGRIESTPTTPTRWVTFMARAIRDGRYTTTATTRTT